MSAEQLTLILIAFLAGMGLGSGIIAWKLSHRKQEPTFLPGSGLMFSEPKKSFWSDWFHGVSTEMAGAIITAVLFTVLLGNAEQRDIERRREIELEDAIRQQKAQLILQMGSPDNGFAIEAIRQLRALNWLTDGTLAGANIAGANLAGADLDNVNLSGATLDSINLQGASLAFANFQDVTFFNTTKFYPSEGPAVLVPEPANITNASIWYSDFRNADLFQVDFSGSDLRYSNLSGIHTTDTVFRNADLQFATFEGAYFDGVNFEGANLLNAYLQIERVWDMSFNRNTVLPDGSYWTPETDMSRFTDPKHPDFWEPEWVKEQREQGQ